MTAAEYEVFIHHLTRGGHWTVERAKEHWPHLT
jgi:hypothetical protein